jgi:uncharacterized protein (DUF849 family)
MNKVIITAAVTGAIHTPTMSDYLPITPDQIVEDAVRAWEAGAAIAHIHVRHPQTGQPITDLGLFREVCSRIKKRCNLVLCPTTGGGVGMTTEERVSQVPVLKPELASLNMGSLSIGIFKLAERYDEFKFPWEREYIRFTYDYSFANTFKTLEVFSKTMLDAGTKPECEIYEVGMVNHVAWLIERGLIKRPPHLQFVLGLFGGIPATAQNLVFLYDTARRQLNDFTWSVAAGGKEQMRMTAMALAMGGNVRVGLEDSLYAGKGIIAQSSADQVKIVVRLAEALGIDVATPDEAREILGLKGLARVNY